MEALGNGHRIIYMLLTYTYKFVLKYKGYKKSLKNQKKYKFVQAKGLLMTFEVGCQCCGGSARDIYGVTCTLRRVEDVLVRIFKRQIALVSVF